MRFIVGVDEVGRGPLAGPVTVGVVLCESKMYKKLKSDKNLPPLGKDSKKLKEKDRKKYKEYLEMLRKQEKIFFSINHVSNKIIDSKGISFAIRKAMEDGIKKLRVDNNISEFLLDGGLKAPEEFKKQKTIIKGDENEQIIAWASILAKVSRDDLMSSISKKYPAYGFHVHKGYGTKLHREAVKNKGVSVVHRVTFCKNIAIL